MKESFITLWGGINVGAGLMFALYIALNKGKKITIATRSILLRIYKLGYAEGVQSGLLLANKIEKKSSLEEITELDKKLAYESDENFAKMIDKTLF